MKVQKWSFCHHIHWVFTSRQHKHVLHHNNKSLLLLLFSILLQHEPSYLSDAAKIQDIAEALMLPRSSLLKFFCLQNYLSLLPNYRLLWCLIYLLTICSIFYTPFYPLPCPKLSLSLQQTSDPSSSEVRCFFQKHLQNVQCRSNPIQDPPFLHLNLACFINASRRHLHPCTQLKKKPCNLHATLMGRRHTKSVDTLLSRTLG